MDNSLRGYLKNNKTMAYTNNEKKHSKKIIWVEQLTLPNIIFIPLQNLFCNFEIHYDKHQITPMAKVLLTLLQQLRICNNLYPTNLTLDKKENNGYGLVYQMEKNLNMCVKKFCCKFLSWESESFQNMIMSYISSFIFYRVTFITMVEARLEFQDIGSKNIFYLPRSPFNPIIINFLKERGCQFQESLVSWKNIKYYLRPLYLLSVFLIQKLSFKKIKNNITSIKPSIWVEYAYEAIVDCAFWHEMIDKVDFDIIYYLDRDDDPPIATIVSAIEKKGFKWIYLHFYSLVKLGNLTLSEIKELIRALLFTVRDLPFWFRVFQFEYKMWFFLYRSVFKHFKVKILIQHQEVSWIQEPQAKAIESVGGIMLGFHWSSFTYWRETFRLVPHHIYFVWGNLFFEWLQKRGNTCRYILPSGLWIGKDKERKEELEYFAKRHKFVIAIFDSSIDYSGHQSADNLSKFYLKIIKLLEENSFWGGMVKSKNWRLDDFKFLSHGEEIISKIDFLIKQNRIIFLNRLVSPATVASYVDLSVCYSINSAGVIAAIHGHRAVHCDSSGLKHHPFYKDTRQQITYLDLDELERAIIRVSKGDKEIGDFSKWRKKFNYFDDFKASVRVGKFIQSFMEKSNSNDFEKSLSLSVKEYIEENKIEDSFFAISECWVAD